MQVSRFHFASPKTWTIICNLGNFYPFSKYVNYHKQFLDFLSVPQKHGLSYVIYGSLFSSLKIWTIICNLVNFFLFSKNMDYHIQFFEFLSLLQNLEKSYEI